MNKSQNIKKTDLNTTAKSGEKPRGRPSKSGGSKSKSASKSAVGKKKTEKPIKKQSKSKSEVKGGAKGKGSKSKGKASKSKGKTSKVGKKGGDKDKAEEDDKVKPSKPIGTYIYYSNSNVPKIKEAEGCSHKEAMSKCGEQWAKASDKEKAPFVKQHEDDIKRYDKQVKELETKGFFMMADGTKSSDHELKKKKVKRSGKSKSEKKRSKKRASKQVKKGKAASGEEDNEGGADDEEDNE